MSAKYYMIYVLFDRTILNPFQSYEFETNCIPETN